jgi:hypothetical protein
LAPSQQVTKLFGSCSICDGACNFAIEASVSPSVIVQICLLNMRMNAITYSITNAIEREKQFSGGAIKD